MEVALQNVSHTNETAQHKAKTCPFTSIANNEGKFCERRLVVLKCVFREKKLIYTPTLTRVKKLQRNYR